MRYVRFAMLLLSFAPLLARAAMEDVRITEIFYDADGADADHEWVELWNGGSEPVTFVGGTGVGSWRFDDGGKDHHHTFAAEAVQGSMAVAAGTFAILAQDAAVFLADHQGFSGTVVQVGAMSMPNSGGTLALRIKDGSVWGQVSYISAWGGAGNGRTLEKIDLTGGNDQSNWRESAEIGGSPGAATSLAVASPPPEPPAPNPDTPTAPEPTAEVAPPAPPPVSPAAEASTPPAPTSNEAEPEEPLILLDIPVAGAASPQTVSGSEKFPKPASSLTPLNQVRELKLNARVRIRGTVIATPVISTGQIFYIADDQAGVQIYSSKKDFPPLAIGDVIEVTGTVGEANGERRVRTLSSTDMRKIGATDPPQPVEVSVAGFGDALLGRLVRIRGAVVARTGTSITVEDASGETAVGSARLQGLQLGEGDMAAVVGVLGRTRSGYRLLPRGSEDVSVTARAAGAKPPASPNAAHPAALILLGGAAVALGLWGRKDTALRAFRAMRIFIKKK